MSVTIDKRGPLFDGRMEKAISELPDTIEKRVATLGASIVRSKLDGSLRTQTPYYRLKVVPRPEAPGWKITDQSVIYGHWLEGDGSRNAPVTRFPGYSSFRLSVQIINARAQAIGNQTVAEYIGRMN